MIRILFFIIFLSYSQLLFASFEKILLVIDMQASFSASQNKSLMNNVEHEIERAIKEKAFILFLEYKDHGSIDYRLEKKMGEYPYYFVLAKPINDGSFYIKKYIDDKNKDEKAFFDLKEMRIVGVNSCGCVRDTLLGLLKHLELTVYKELKFILVSKALHCHCDYGRTYCKECDYGNEGTYDGFSCHFGKEQNGKYLFDLVPSLERVMIDWS